MTLGTEIDGAAKDMLFKSDADYAYTDPVVDSPDFPSVPWHGEKYTAEGLEKDSGPNL